ncbi:BCHE [Cordylochernes scorpioides]|uniref:Carboxylic ester hydrolase n=1 Tax=Cordylochernes scorpioides TaxID=51811 RepID=A0ABY6LB09_9ARAC|nr:BCHE [Cordylochernes scorpioides]
MELMILLIGTFLVSAKEVLSQTVRVLPGTKAIVLGKRHNVNGKLLDVFLSIPYARPPVGKLRYREPQPIPMISQVIEAYEFPPSCIQKLFNPEDHVTKRMSEDCLYLNIWTPSKRKYRAVMVFFHGGAFVEGSSDLYANNPQFLAARNDIVVVTFNYRLGSLGFLDLESKDAEGNQGLLDQLLALNWIYQYIEGFGGDSLKITLYGVSSGAMSIGFHLNIPQNQNIFKRVFLQSGTPNSGYFEILKRQKEMAMDFYLRGLGCKSDTPVMIECAETKSLKEIAMGEKVASVINQIGTFGPSFKSRYIPIRSIIDFNQKRVLRKPMLIGITKDEASFTLPFLKRYFMGANLTKKAAIVHMQQFLGIERGKGFKYIANHYLENVKEYDNRKYARAFKELIADLFFRCPSYYFANMMASKNIPVYFYYFAYQSRYKAENVATRYLGAAHGEEQQYFLGLPQRNFINYTEEEYSFAETMMQFMGNFVKYGWRYAI